MVAQQLDAELLTVLLQVALHDGIHRPFERYLAERKALGYTVGVAVAAAPDTGFRLLEQLAAAADKDVCWVVRENLKKNRLKPWAQRVEVIEAML